VRDVGAPEVVLDRVWKTFALPEGAKQAPAALRDVSLTVERGELMVVVGPSGCGKSTTLRLIAGLDDPDDGTVTLAGKPMKSVPPQDRDVGMVFQGYALYPQMTVREILEFPLRMRKVGKDERARAVKEAAELLRIEPLLGRLPAELSGGERQRVAMGRTIVRRPRVFLFDEPLSNLDAALRADIRLEIGALVRRLEATAIYVTHDHVEAMTLADRIAVMRKGRVLQCATPREIYERPATSFVGTFLGAPRMNLLKGRVVDGAVECGPFRLPRPKGELPDRVEVGVRPEHVRLADDGAPARVVAVEPLGAETHLVVEVAGGLELRLRSQGFDQHARGDEVKVALDVSRAHVFDPFQHGARIEGSLAP
jgi:sn-glycerol 3-phosphate transport system ATP-binding protein